MAEEGGPEAEGVALAAALEAQLEVPVICERMGGVRDMYISTSVYPNRPLIQCQKLTAHVYIFNQNFRWGHNLSFFGLGAWANLFHDACGQIAVILKYEL